MAQALSGRPPLLSLRRYGASHGSHTHDFFQILVGLDGALELEIEGRGRRVASGEGCVIAPGARHDFESRAGSRCLVLDTFERRWACSPSAPARPHEALLLARYLAEALPNAGALTQQIGAQLMLDAWNPSVAMPARRSRRAIDWPQLADWAHRHLHEQLDVAQLAAKACLSPTQFAARCREETGLSAMQWLRSQRLAQARSLRANGATLSDAAQQCGYQSPSALAAALRRDQ